MPCYCPIRAFRSAEKNPSGKRSIVFNVSAALAGRGFADPDFWGSDDGIVKIACGQCVGCRLERSRQWAVRLMHELRSHKASCFLTLTYNDQCLPVGGTLVLSDFQNFMKRLRKRFGKGIRFFHCGEYGEKLSRPHYHAIIFGVDFAADKQLHTYSPAGFPIYRSPTLERLWTFGYSSIQDVTFDSCAYVARYIMKKRFGQSKPLYYNTVDLSTGEILAEKKPEYITMSRRPGIGKKYFDQYKKEIYATDSIVLNGREMRPPKYYDSQYEILDPEHLEEVKHARYERAKRYFADQTEERLSVRKKIQELRARKLIRAYEKGDTL